MHPLGNVKRNNVKVDGGFAVAFLLNSPPQQLATRVLPIDRRLRNVTSYNEFRRLFSVVGTHGFVTGKGISLAMRPRQCWIINKGTKWGDRTRRKKRNLMQTRPSVELVSFRGNSLTQSRAAAAATKTARLTDNDIVDIIISINDDRCILSGTERWG